MTPPCHDLQAWETAKDERLDALDDDELDEVTANLTTIRESLKSTEAS